MEKETEERLTALEMKLAYMEDFVNQIQGVAVEQTKTIDKLQKEIKMMSEKIREMSGIMLKHRGEVLISTRIKILEKI